MPFIIVGVLLLVLFTFLISTYNSLASYKVEVDNAWSQIDVQLKRRHDLIPNLVESVKGVMNFEKETLTQVMQARSAALSAASQGERLKAENELSQGVGRLLAVWENYPDLKASGNARELQEELTSTENKIAYARSHFNDVCSNYNAMLLRFPSNLIATMVSFRPHEFLQAAEPDKAVPEVKF